MRSAILRLVGRRHSLADANLTPERMPRLRRARSGRGQNLQKSALRWRPTVGQTASSILLDNSRQSLPTLLPLQLRVFRAPNSGNRNVHGFPANYPACPVLPNEINDCDGFYDGLQTGHRTLVAILRRAVCRARSLGPSQRFGRCVEMFSLKKSKQPRPNLVPERHELTSNRQCSGSRFAPG
jgi:hypothetical protein